ncbi:MAG: hypothetical protein GF383_14465 [Candidatus Lokiarchaeota archaeon]|nr:hypothetical protein [Candidatus Lokiarchaeota archaeon]MBD3342597.1 hypothetical protein [Candidatus Lokiarchaeota archaeon]
MPVDPETAAYNLMQSEPSIIAVAILQGRDIIYSTDNWDISADIGRVLSSWSSMNAQFIMISGVKYSMLQCTSERIVATSIRGEGHIVGAKDEEHKLIAYVEPDGPMNVATMEAARTIGSMSSKGAYIDSSTQLGGDAAGGVAPSPAGGASVDPQLKGEIQGFLDWIKDSEGLAGYINYYLQQNNSQIISELSKIYGELRQIFGV